MGTANHRKSLTLTREASNVSTRLWLSWHLTRWCVRKYRSRHANRRTLLSSWSLHSPQSAVHSAIWSRGKLRQNTAIIRTDTNSILCACVVYQVTRVFGSRNLIFPMRSNSVHRCFTVRRTRRTVTLRAARIVCVNLCLMDYVRVWSKCSVSSG
jgi:hypothetical protein